MPPTTVATQGSRFQIFALTSGAMAGPTQFPRRLLRAFSIRETGAEALRFVSTGIAAQAGAATSSTLGIGGLGSGYDKLVALARLEDGWDGPETQAPTLKALRAGSLILRALWRVGLWPPQITATDDGGVAIMLAGPVEASGSHRRYVGFTAESDGGIVVIQGDRVSGRSKVAAFRGVALVPVARGLRKYLTA
jgi:hypothetical protein